ncbi:aminopeptidase [Niveibacterium sp. SC-1]|uniref:aminopeptidase n=1 Tax=Niveibacterium sp. SC-1 TaxID=3135646 RepID=UPI00311EA6CE
MRTSIAVLATVLCSACSVSPSYYWQAAGGQIELLRAARPITEIEASAETPEPLRQRLALVQQLRHFASGELGLAESRGFDRYADIKRPYVVWNVFAAPALSSQSREWCVPVAGCVGYLGYFALEDARAQAASLKAEGMDVYVGGVPAYSTLGWFSDPVLNTYVQWPELDLARLIFHELAHQVVYVKGDTEFNESFAVAVEQAGLRRWAAQPEKATLMSQFERAHEIRDDFAALVLETRGALQALYAEPLPEADKRARKAALITQMQTRYHQLRDGKWQGFAGYDRWFAQDINNAQLNSVGFYTRWVPAFEALLAREGDDLPRFYAAVKRLAQQPEPQRHRSLAALEHTPSSGELARVD